MIQPITARLKLKTVDKNNFHLLNFALSSPRRRFIDLSQSQQIHTMCYLFMYHLSLRQKYIISKHCW